VLGSPPYFPPGSGIEGDHPQKVACRFELRGDIRDYCAVARRISRRRSLRVCVSRGAASARRIGPRVWSWTGHRAAAAVVVQGGRAAARHAVSRLVRAGDVPEAMRDRTWVEPALVIRARRRHAFIRSTRR
jgi:hypothetical protein